MSSQGNILLADDENTFLEATQDLLEEEGFDCQTVRNAQELSAALEVSDFDLLITDLNMPGNRVLEMVDEVRTQSKALPVIVVTGYPSLPSAVESVRLNVLEYLIKPVDFQKLLGVVQRGIQHKQALRAVQRARHEATERVTRLAKIEKTLSDFGENVDEETGSALSTDPALKELHLKMEGLTDLIKASGQEASSLGASLSGNIDNDYYKVREGLYEAIQVLQQTKGSFRSKELASLRIKLQTLLRETSSASKDS